MPFIRTLCISASPDFLVFCHCGDLKFIVYWMVKCVKLFSCLDRFYSRTWSLVFTIELFLISWFDPFWLDICSLHLWFKVFKISQWLSESCLAERIGLLRLQEKRLESHLSRGPILGVYFPTQMYSHFGLLNEYEVLKYTSCSLEANNLFWEFRILNELYLPSSIL